MGDPRAILLGEIARGLLRNPFFSIPVDSRRPVDPLLHQTELVARALLLYPTRMLIADTIGLGKTVEALRILHSLRAHQPVRRVLVVVPAVLEKQWGEEVRRFGFEPKGIGDLVTELEQGEGVEGVYVVRMDTVKKDEYIHDVERVQWDVIIVDEAHRLAPKILRSRIVELARRNPETTVLLLSATPHRGKEKHYLYLLSTLDPSLYYLIPKREKREKSVAGSDFYSSTHLVMVHRRTKGDVNSVYEQREVFKPAEMVTIVLKPTAEERALLAGLVEIGRSAVSRYYRRTVEAGVRNAKSVRGITGLLSLLLKKRGTSSPRAFVETFSRLLSKRVGELAPVDPRTVERDAQSLREALMRYWRGEADVELDEEFNRFASDVLASGLLSEDEVNRLADYFQLASRILSGELRDTKVEFLLKLVDLAKTRLEGRFADLYGAKVIVFTEFKDTAYYVYERLVAELGRRYPEARDMVRVLTSDNKKEYRDVVEWLGRPGVKVLVATDVMSEGLNLQHANVVVNYEVVYSPIKLEQRLGRVWRYGQNRVVYAFNLFFLDTIEERIHDIFFRKIYAITESLGKQELDLGEDAYLVTLHNTVFDGVLRETKGESPDDQLGRYIAAVPIAKLLEKERGQAGAEEYILLRLLETSDDREYAKFLEKLATRLVKEIERLAKLIRSRRVYPEQASRSSVEGLLQSLWGIRNHEEADRVADLIIRAYSAISSDRDLPKNRVEALVRVAKKTAGPATRTPVKLVVNDPSKRIYIVYSVGVAVGRRTVSDIVAVEIDMDVGTSRTLRGVELVETVAGAVLRSLPVDEIYGDLWRRVEQYFVPYASMAKGSIGVARVLDRVRRYEEVKARTLARVGTRKARELYATDFQHREPEVVAVLLTAGLLPRSAYRPQTGVWGSFERRYLMDVVMKYEREAGRSPELRHESEHYDVFSSNAVEERYIECKGFEEPRLDFQLTEAEYEAAKRYGDRYWVYMVYGVGTSEPVVLAIRNPLSKFKPVPRRYVVEELRYVFSPGVQP